MSETLKYFRKDVRVRLELDYLTHVKVFRIYQALLSLAYRLYTVAILS